MLEFSAIKCRQLIKQIECSRMLGSSKDLQESIEIRIIIFALIGEGPYMTQRIEDI